MLDVVGSIAYVSLTTGLVAAAAGDAFGEAILACPLNPGYARLPVNCRSLRLFQNMNYLGTLVADEVSCAGYSKAQAIPVQY